ncbi:MAG: DUF2085 domain-containing protein, partial [Chloroflexaceae bacterium]|nr:DUF2085 domain-containing protein [Chloroflexaceae bacterium]
MHTASPSFQTTARPPLRWPGWIFNTLLTILFLGPIAAPLFRATGLPGVADLGLLAQVLLNTYICPTPAWAYEVAGYPMAVCARCWGATIGLWAARLMLVPGMHSQSWWADGLRGYRALPLPNRLLLSAAPVVLWPIEIIGT